MVSPKFTLSFEHEQRLWREGIRFVAGIDEVGRGALAGPVVAGAVIVAQNESNQPVWKELRDSKQLSPANREKYAQWICRHSHAWGIGQVSAAAIDEMNIAAATRLAMKRAVESLRSTPQYLLVDWVRLINVNLPQESFVKADAKIISVAAASIIAKVYRDRLLVDLDREYPLYGFARNKGYGTKAHRNALDKYGPCREHRHSFSPIARARTLFD